MHDDSATHRAILPMPDLVRHGLTTYDAKDPDTAYPPIRELRPPEGAPNVLVILIDDAGFGSSSAFGGPVRSGDRRSTQHGEGRHPGSSTRACSGCPKRAS